ncbi:PhoD-like phosphatase [Oculatella sp. LEGE 06141]|uniref:PhoD-like phosphatase n=1 Tax=Oculatella sp. LEGE 06141 TaxID=1828648 RepID=UPI0018800D30|nr:PhoD-like phosphatase [Oculatella sp. LEGE 06141]MBE9182639.1 PhoD-like phosphatase [Oculatella sp. LEGE 06141]
MPWIPLSYRLNQLPLILAGPILRRTESNSVTVWVALRSPCKVVLTIHATEQGNGSRIHAPVMEGDRSTVRLGEHLHVVAVTAAAPDHRLHAQQVYAYDLMFELDEDRVEAFNNGETGEAASRQTLQQALNSPALSVQVSYFDHGLPTFALPPTDLNHLRIAHGSCRKPLGEGLDALPILDDLIEQTALDPIRRPHQLFFTGDQIYGDDVANPLLLLLTEAGDTLLGWEEPLPIAHSSTSGSTYVTPNQLKPGQRSEIAEAEGGLTAGLQKQPERAKSHLFGFGEYCTTYLLFWSQTLWPEEFPDGREVYDDAKQVKTWNKEARELQEFAYSLNKVRRLLANVPTYMIFDDHDISDDWYLNQAWCLRVLGKPLGRRTVQNGMLAYAIFQGWGNTPEQFQPGQVGEQLLTAAAQWSNTCGRDDTASDAIARYLGLPESDALTGLPKLILDGDVFVLDRDPIALTWHYTIRSTGHDVIVLDTRTWRGYPAGDALPTAPPMLLSPTAFEQQIRQPMQQCGRSQRADDASAKATLVVAPTNLVGLQLIDWIQHWNLKQRKVFENDVGDAWNIHKSAFAQLLSILFEQRDQVIVLSGDIHYGSAVRLKYWLHPSDGLQDPAQLESQEIEQACVLAQLTASAFSNAELKTRIVHTKLKSLLPEANRKWVGWSNPPDVAEVKTVRAIAAKRHDAPPDWTYQIEWIKRQPAYTASWARQVLWLRLHHEAQMTALKRFTDWLALLWRNRWIQDGREVVGVNNLGIVHLSWSADITQRSVTQDLYWYPIWKPDSIVSSRYEVPLGLNEMVPQEKR